MSEDKAKHGRGLLSHGRVALPYPRRLVETLAFLLTLGGVGWALDLYSRTGLEIYDQQFLAAMLAIALPMAFLKFPITGKIKKDLPWYDALAAIAGIRGGRLSRDLLSDHRRSHLPAHGRQRRDGAHHRVPADRSDAALDRAGAAHSGADFHRLCAACQPPSGFRARHRLAQACDLSCRRHQWRARPADQGRDHHRDRIRSVRAGSARHRRDALLHRRRHGVDGALPRWRRQDRGARLISVRVDLRQRRRQCGGDRDRHHPADEARRRTRP